MQDSKLQIIRRSSFKSTPWKNGGGVTHEAIRVPESGDAFRWRVSVAHIDASGPFSEFTGYNRKMVLLRGAGIDLRFADGTHQSLRQAGELVEFDGAVAAHCELVSGPCVDLNLMVSKADRVAVRVERLVESLAVSAPRGETTLVFAVDRGFTLQVTDGKTEKTETLEPWDLAILEHCDGRLGSLEPAHSSASTSVFLATLKLVGGQ